MSKKQNAKHKQHVVMQLLDALYLHPMHYICIVRWHGTYSMFVYFSDPARVQSIARCNNCSDLGPAIDVLSHKLRLSICTRHVLPLTLLIAPGCLEVGTNDLILSAVYPVLQGPRLQLSAKRGADI